MVGKIFITRQGYDARLGKHVKDPYLGPNPTLGACRPCEAGCAAKKSCIVPPMLTFANWTLTRRQTYQQ